MHKQLFLFFAFFLAVPFLACQDIATRTSAVDQARQIVRKTHEKENFPGMAVAVYRKGELIWSEGFGYADIANEIPVNPATSLFRIGSVSKTLTAAGLMRLWQEGVIDLDRQVHEYVQEFPDKKYPVTIRQVANHLGGIRHYQGIEFASNVHYESVVEGLKIFAKDPLIHEPGTKWAYSSYGWNLVSAAMETVSGEEFLDYMEKNIFIPFKMNNTVADDATIEISDRVQFYSQQDDQRNLEAPPVDNSYKWAGGGFLSTAHDLIQFGHTILSFEILSKETMQETWTSGTDNKGKAVNYGIGWRIGEDKKERHWVGHGGGSMGGTSMFLMYPDEELIVVTLVNLSSARMGNLAFRIAEQFLSNE